MSAPYILKIGGDYVWEQSFQRWGVQDLLDEFLKKKYNWKIELMRRIQSRVACGAKLVLAPSNYLAQVAISWGVRREKVSVIYNNIDSIKVLTRAEARKALGISENKKILFSFGRDVPWKGFEMLREIMPEVLKKHPEAELVTGEVSRERRDLWLAATDVFLLNTGYEGFSHQILEAMSLGLPIITTNAGGNKEIVENEKNALVLEYNNKKAWIMAINRILSDKDLQKKLSDGAKVTAQKFLQKDMVGETIKVLQEVVNISIHRGK
jgi:glycosyltransferase involved in cell wall biosynthesis